MVHNPLNLSLKVPDSDDNLYSESQTRPKSNYPEMLKPDCDPSFLGETIEQVEPAECKAIPKSTEEFPDVITKPEVPNFVMITQATVSIEPPKVCLYNNAYVFLNSGHVDNNFVALKDGYRYQLMNHAIIEIGKRGSTLVTNCRPVITAFINMYNENGKHEELVQGYLSTETGNIPYIVKKRNYKNLFRIIHEEHSEIFVTKNLGDGSESALSDIYKAAKADPSIPTITQVEINGWYCIDGKPAWHTGVDEAYSNTVVPDVSSLNKADVFNQGSNFLNIGHGNAPIAIIWLFAHAAISKWWLKQVGIEWKSALIVQGITNSFKTFTVSQIANVFSMDRDDVRLPIALMTDAGGRRKIATLRGQVALIDDYSKSSRHSAERSRELAEKLIRMNGDSGGHIKAATGSSRKTVTEKIDCVLIFTAETDFGLGNSSNTRCVTVRSHSAILDRDGNVVKPATFDKDVIQHFQDNHYLLKNYFAAYISFLTAFGSSLLPVIKKNFRLYRNEYGGLFKTPRMAETAAMLRVQSDLCCEFAKYSGITDTTNFANCYNNAILETIFAQQQKTNDFQPTVLFLKTLRECLEGYKIAETEIEYVTGFDYVGFHQRKDDTLWVNHEWAWDTVSSTLRKKGIEWLVTFDSLKEALYEQGYILAQKRTIGGNDYMTYLPRAKKGKRKSMLVLYFTKMMNLTEGSVY